MQIPIVNRRWSDREFNPNGSAKESYDVSGVASDTDAMAAVGISIKSSHPQDSRLIVPEDGISVTSVSPIMYRVTANYVTKGGSFEANPLDEPANIDIDFCSGSWPIDFDTTGNPITNSAHVPFSSPVFEDHIDIQMKISQYESTFDIQKALAYTSPFPTLNQDTITIPKIGTLQPGQLKLCKVRLGTPVRADESDQSQSYVQVDYICEARDYWPFTGAGHPISGFAKRVLDQGLQGTCADFSEPGLAVIAPLVHQDETRAWVQVASEVLLDGEGAPMRYPAIRIRNADAVPAKFTPYKNVAIEKTDDACWLYYETLRRMPFAGLGWKFR